MEQKKVIKEPTANEIAHYGIATLTLNKGKWLSTDEVIKNTQIINYFVREYREWIDLQIAKRNNSGNLTEVNINSIFSEIPVLKTIYLNKTDKDFIAELKNYPCKTQTRIDSILSMLQMSFKPTHEAPEPILEPTLKEWVEYKDLMIPECFDIKNIGKIELFRSKYQDWFQLIEVKPYKCKFKRFGGQWMERGNGWDIREIKPTNKKAFIDAFLSPTVKEYVGFMESNDKKLIDSFYSIYKNWFHNNDQNFAPEDKKDNVLRPTKKEHEKYLSYSNEHYCDLFCKKYAKWFNKADFIYAPEPPVEPETEKTYDQLIKELKAKNKGKFGIMVIEIDVLDQFAGV